MMFSLLRTRCYPLIDTTRIVKGVLSEVPLFNRHRPIESVDYQHRFASGRSRRGLYDGKDIRTGNNVSFSQRKTKRKFKPNVFRKRLYSEILDDMLRFHLTTSALRSIDKAGGLDNYLLQNEFTEGEGYEAKRKILKRMKNQARYERKQTERMHQAEDVA